MKGADFSVTPLETLALRYWMASILLLAVGLSTGGFGFVPVAALTVLHGLHFMLRERSATAFSVQVRVAYLLLIGAAQIPQLGWFAWAMLAGTTIRVTFDYCFLARTLSLLPWNRAVPLTWRRVIRTYLTPPTQGSVAQHFAEHP